jgi:UDP-2,3-diacylglucosamine hydrolase
MNMKAVFISDAHLRKSSDERYIKLMDFFDDIKAGKLQSDGDFKTENTSGKLIDDLYIAGDFFDFWFCRKENINPEFKPVIEKLIELKKAGIRVHLSEGNHDFFMKEYFHDVLGMEVYEEFAEAKLDNLDALIAHGDTADSANTSYVLLRRILRSWAFYNFQRFIPASIRWTIAKLCSTTSKELTVENGDALLKKMSSFAFTRFQKGFDAVILGHCHVPSVNYYTMADKKRAFVTLGDWIRHYSYLYYENNNFFLRHY